MPNTREVQTNSPYRHPLVDARGLYAKYGDVTLCQDLRLEQICVSTTVACKIMKGDSVAGQGYRDILSVSLVNQSVEMEPWRKSILKYINATKGSDAEKRKSLLPLILSLDPQALTACNHFLQQSGKATLA